MNMLTAQTRQVLRKIASKHTQGALAHASPTVPPSPAQNTPAQHESKTIKTVLLCKKHTNTISTNRAHADTDGLSDDTLRTKTVQHRVLEATQNHPCEDTVERPLIA
jgi:hypothetical protein